MANSPTNRSYPTILSIIVDLEDSSKTGLPYCGREYAMSKKLDHHLTGAKMHGEGMYFFPTVNTVHKSANLTAYCLLRSVELFFEKYKRFPEEIYIQVRLITIILY